jgi:hypothetical protein
MKLPTFRRRFTLKFASYTNGFKVLGFVSFMLSLKGSLVGQAG